MTTRTGLLVGARNESSLIYDTIIYKSIHDNKAGQYHILLRLSSVIIVISVYRDYDYALRHTNETEFKHFYNEKYLPGPRTEEF